MGGTGNGGGEGGLGEKGAGARPVAHEDTDLRICIVLIYIDLLQRLPGGWTESSGMERTVLEAFDGAATGVDPVIDGDPIIGGDVSDHMGGVGR